MAIHRVNATDQMMIEQLVEKYTLVALLKALSEAYYDKSVMLAEQQLTNAAKKYANEANRIYVLANSADETI